MKTNKYTKPNAFLSIFFGILLLPLTTMTIQAQTLTLQSPNGGEVWTFGQSEIITWTGSDLSNIVSVHFSYDGGVNWWYFGEVPSAPNGGSAMLSVPNIQTTNAILKLSDVSQPVATDMSDEPFTVFIPAISIYEPYSASAVFAGSVTLIYWILNVFDFSLINAEVSIDNGMTFTPVAQNIDAQAGSTYLVLSDIPADSCILKLYNTQDPSEFGLSQVFRISPRPVYNLISPVAGELVNTYSPYTISWTVENPYSTYCYLEYSVNNGQSWEIIDNAMNEGNSGNYEWYTPNVDSDECLVRITDSYALSEMDTSGMFSIFTFPETPVCMVTVDSVTNYNVVMWERPVSDIVADFLVYKETDEANVYEVIDTVGYEEITMVTDFGSNPGMRPYRYKIGFIDFENRLFPAGDYHQTIHLTINQGVNDAWNLIWTPYIGFDYSSYKIMRKSETGEYEQIATVSSSFSSFTDFNAPPGEVFYMIKIDHPAGCNPANRDGDYASVYSNVASNSIVSVSEKSDLDFTIYPIPADNIVSVSFGENINGNVTLILSDLTGRVVYSETIMNVRPGKVQTINSIGFKEGMYLLRIASGENSVIRKIVIKR
jgi:hypothetical protein